MADYVVESLATRECTFVYDEPDLFGEVNLKVFPGHTPGGLVAILKRDVRVVLYGDVVKNAWELVQRKPFMVTTDYHIAVSSMGKLLGFAYYFVPGHNSPFCSRNRDIEFLSKLYLNISVNVKMKDLLYLYSFAGNSIPNTALMSCFDNDVTALSW